jgi:hypothetical protein
MAVMIAARCLAPLILRPWRRARYYGWGLIAVSGGLCVLLALGLEPLAVMARGYWTWPAGAGFQFLGWFVGSAAALFLAAPWFIDKRGLAPPPDLLPLALWLPMNLWTVVGNGWHGNWPAVSVSLTLNAAVTLLTLRGARGCRAG